MPEAVTYVLYSQKLDRYYIGATKNLESRLLQHNAGRNKSTSAGVPWKVKYVKTFNDFMLARRYESVLKKKKSRKYLEWLINSKQQ